MEGALLAEADNRTVCLDGQKVTALRRARSLSREQLAELADGAHRLSVATIKRAENGAPVYLETARRLAGLLGAQSVRELLPAGEADSANACAGLESLGMAVAVIPFRAVGSGAEARVLADGITEDLTTRLGYSWFPVIAYSSLVTLRGELGERLVSELGVSYFVEGSVQASDGRFRVHARLVDARSGRVIWSEACNRRQNELLALQDELAGAIAEQVSGHVLDATARTGAAGQTQGWEAFQLIAQGVQRFYRYAPAENLAARTLLTRVVEQDPNTAHVWYVLALTYQQELVHHWCESPQDALRNFAEIVARFRALHERDARCELVTAYGCIYQGQRERAEEHVTRAIEAAPNLHNAYSLLAQLLAMSGDADGALERAEIATRLNPRGPDLWQLKTVTALAHFVAGNYADSASWAEVASALRPEAAFPLGTLAAAAALAGDHLRARTAIERLRAAGLTHSERLLAVVSASTEASIRDRYVRGLRLAGLS